MIVVALVATSILAYIWGILTCRYKVFPYRIIHALFTGNESISVDTSTSQKAEERNKNHIISSPPQQQYDFVFLGDSITYRNDWQSAFLTSSIGNLAVNDEVDGMAEGILRRQDSWLATNPKVAFIMVGYYDLNSGRSDDEILEKYLNVIDLFESHNIRTIIQSTLSTNRNARGDYIFNRIKKFNLKLIKKVQAKGLDYIDLNAALSHAQEGLQARYTSDGVHLTPLAYDVWQEILRPYFTDEECSG